MPPDFAERGSGQAAFPMRVGSKKSEESDATLDELANLNTTILQMQRKLQDLQKEERATLYVVADLQPHYPFHTDAPARSPRNEITDRALTGGSARR